MKPSYGGVLATFLAYYAIAVLVLVVGLILGLSSWLIGGLAFVALLVLTALIVARASKGT